MFLEADEICRRYFQLILEFCISCARDHNNLRKQLSVNTLEDALGCTINYGAGDACIANNLCKNLNITTYEMTFMSKQKLIKNRKAAYTFFKLVYL